METVVFVTRTRWSEIPRLRHQMARLLADRFRVLFVQTPVKWRRWYSSAVEEVERNVFLFSPTNRWNLPARVKTSIQPADEFLQDLMLREIQKVLPRVGISSERPLLLNFNHTATRLMRSDMFRAAVYVCNDDWIAKAPDRWTRRAAGRREASVAAAADLCIAVSYPLRDRLLRLNPNTHLLLPAHSFNVEANVVDPIREAIGPTRVLFVGELNARVNYGWLERAAGEDDIEVHVVGPVMIPHDLVNDLTHSGVHFHAPLFGEDLKAFMRTMDVLVIPYHVREGVVAATAPNKLFMCVAAGRPVVISDMPHFLDLGAGIIYRGRNSGDFISQIRLARAEDREELRTRRLEIAQENTWQRRGGELFQLLEELPR